MGVKATVYKNPFRPADRDIITIEMAPGESLDSYVAKLDLPEDMDFAVSLNGAMIPAGQRAVTVPQTGDWIAVCPVMHGGVLKTIVAVVVSVIAFAVVGPAVATWLFPAGAATATAAASLAWTLTAGIAAGVFTAVGGMLLSGMGGSPTADFGSLDYSANLQLADGSSSQTYSWASMQSLQSQGSPVMILFGTIRTAGQILAEHVSMADDKQYYNGLLCGGEGPIDSITDIKVNDNPIGNYSSVVCETRTGTNDQAIVSYFGDTFDDQTLSYEVNFLGEWATYQTEGDAAQGIEVLLVLPGGLYYMTDTGEKAATSVTVAIEYRVSGGSWTAFSTPTFSDATANAIRRTFRLDGLTPARYEVRVRGVARDGQNADGSVSNRYSNRVYWSMLSSIIYDDFSRPNKVLVGVRALATDQLSGGRPTISWLQTRSMVWVWNPNTLSYEQRAATNPAWACYDLIHYCRKLMNVNTGQYEYVVRGDSANRILYSDFLAWAAFCDARNLKVNLLVEKAAGLWSTLAPFEIVGRGKVLKFGTRWGCICDAPSAPVQLFSMGNIKQGSYREEYLGVADRANAVEITFTNAAKNYQRDSLTVYGDDYDTEGVVKNPSQITLNGITSAEQAYREGKYRLSLNKYILRTEAWEADIDAIACRVGDVVLVQHDVPIYGEGGRVVSATASTVTVDRTMLLDHTKTYQIIIRLKDDTMVTRSIVVPGTDTETDTLTVSTLFATLPEQYDVYAFGETNKVAKPVRIISIGRTQEQTRAIVAMEYNEAVYNEATVIPEIEYVAGGPWNVTGLSVIPAQSSAGQLSLIASWQPPRNRYQGARVLCNGLAVATTDGYAREATFAIPSHGAYAIMVLSVDAFGNQIGSAAATINTYSFVPASVTGLLSEALVNGRKRFYWQSALGSVTVAGYRLRITPGVRPYWPSGQLLHSNLIAASPFETDAISPGQYVVMIKAVSNTGLESIDPAYVIYSLGDELVENVIIQTDIAATGFPGTKTNCTVAGGNLVADDTGGLFYATDDEAEFYGSDTEYFYRTNYKAATYQQSVPVEPGQLLIQTTAAGLGEISYRVSPPFYGIDENSFFYGEDADPFYPPPLGWTPYTGKANINTDEIEILSNMQAGVNQGQITALTVIVDVPDESETLSDIVVSAAGTRLPITKAYRSIKNVNVTIQSTGASARSAILVDKDRIDGPLIRLYNTAGTQVDGIVDAEVQGSRL